MKRIYKKYFKRVIDIAGASIVLVLASPLLLAVASLVRWKLGRPILFVQDRTGRGGQTFRFVKFRSMLDSRDERGDLLPDEQRLTGFGRWLRRTSLDELPQLWNVLAGDMSLVGPRPLPAQYLSRYSQQQARRHEVRPGITGWAQIHGRNQVHWEKRFELDVWYVDHIGPLLDAKILFMTPLMLLMGRGVSAAGHATMPEFSGTATTQER